MHISLCNILVDVQYLLFFHWLLQRQSSTLSKLTSTMLEIIRQSRETCESEMGTCTFYTLETSKLVVNNVNIVSNETCIR